MSLLAKSEIGHWGSAIHFMHKTCSCDTSLYPSNKPCHILQNEKLREKMASKDESVSKKQRITLEVKIKSNILDS